jgi:hypothetical protein
LKKRIGSSALSLFLVTGFWWSLTTGNAHAYIDAGSGSLLIQVLIAGMFGFLFTAKLFWQRITGWFATFLGLIKRGKGKEDI